MLHAVTQQIDATRLSRCRLCTDQGCTAAEECACRTVREHTGVLQLKSYMRVSGICPLMVWVPGTQAARSAYTGAAYLFNIESLDPCQLLMYLSLKHQLVHLPVLKA